MCDNKEQIRSIRQQLADEINDRNEVCWPCDQYTMVTKRWFPLSEDTRCNPSKPNGWDLEVIWACPHGGFMVTIGVFPPLQNRGDRRNQYGN